MVRGLLDSEEWEKDDAEVSWPGGMRYLRADYPARCASYKDWIPLLVRLTEQSEGNEA